MAEYHVGCGMIGIYAGTVKANGKEWKDKTRVTDEAVEAVRDWLVSKAEEEKQGFYGYAWDTKDGKTVILKVTIKNKEQSDE